MNRYMLVFTVSLVALFFITGCPSSEQTAPPVQTEAPEILPSPPQPPLDQDEAEPNQADLPPPEPNVSELQTEKPPAFESDSDEPNYAEPVGSETAPTELETTPAKPETPQAECESASSLHDKCARIFRTYVDEKGNVDYATLSRRKLELIALLSQFEDLNPAAYGSWSTEDKIAFWINTYNLHLLKIIIDNYPIRSSRVLRLFWPPNSIRHIKGLWDQHKFIVMDEQFTLKEIEQRFFLAEFDDPRIFSAISYASVSSPPLRNEPYYGDMLSEQLDDQVSKYLSSQHGFKIDKDNGKIYLSVLFKWHAQQFVNKFGTDKKFKDQDPAVRAVLNFITYYIPEQDVAYLETANYSIGYLKYYWTLNE